MNNEINFRTRIQPKEAEFLSIVEASGPTKIFAGGPRGGGKSYSARTIAAIEIFGHRGLQAVLLRRTYPDLFKNHIKKLIYEEHPEIEPFYNVAERMLAVPQYGTLFFEYAENEADLRRKFQGQGYDLIFIEEASQFSQDEIEFLYSTNRPNCEYFRPKVILTFNWGGKSHSYLKRVCIDKEFLDNENSKDFTYLPIYGWDNDFWVSSALKEDGLTTEDYQTWSNGRRQEYFITRSDYGKKLFQLPHTEREQQLYGNPDVYEGMFFSIFRRSVHVEPFKDYIHQNNFPLIGVIDYGHRTVLEIMDTDYENRGTFIDECYVVESGAALRANIIAEFLVEHPQYWDLNILCDTNMDFDPDDPGDSEKAPITIFRKVIKGVFRAHGINHKVPNLRIVSKRTTDSRGYRVYCNEAFKSGLSTSQIRILPRCKHLIESITSLVYRENDYDGLDFDPKVGEDDPYDAAKMAYVNSKSMVLKDDANHILPSWFTYKTEGRDGSLYERNFLAG